MFEMELDSDDEPLSKKVNVCMKNGVIYNESYKNIDGKISTKQSKKLIRKGRLQSVMSFNVSKVKSETLNLIARNYSRNNIFEKPIDVWLYLKDLNTTGPYSCLLCSDWFINRSKLIIHYILNHKKEYCGICRYFVEDRTSWTNHWTYHLPLQCSHCQEMFPSETALRQHFSAAHGYVHCRLCHFMQPDGPEYDKHLCKKHYVTIYNNKNADVFWNADNEISTKYLCLLCEKRDLQKTDFFKHYVCYHRFTVKCLAGILAGRDVPFSVFGASVDLTQFEDDISSSRILNTGFKDSGSNGIVSGNTKKNFNLMEALIPEIKQEYTSDGEDKNTEVTNKPMEIVEVGKDVLDSNEAGEETHIDYEGKEDFDVTLLELIMFSMKDVYYVDSILNDLNAQTVPVHSSTQGNEIMNEEQICQLCALNDRNDKYVDLSIHSAKMHGFKYVSQYVCRLCFARFDSENDLSTHSLNEMKEFNDLYLCQFCDTMFISREDARSHLSVHWNCLTVGNCFSPQLGFKCKYCFQLFWNEFDRESHHCSSHFVLNKDNFYKCADCQKIFSDKIWYIHHYWRHHNNKSFGSSTYVVKCLLCCTVFKDVAHVREHFQFWHPEARKIYCNLGECFTKPFSTIRSLKAHVKNMHSRRTNSNGTLSTLFGGSQGVNVCGVCGREFNTGRATAVHMAQAHGAGRFKCLLCSTLLHTNDERKLHYMFKHPGHAPYECSICGNRFQNKSSLYLHRTQQHIAHLRTYTCSYCGKTFTKRDSYREHIMIHVGPRHACSYCPRLFVQRSNMLRHERRHTGERPYTCLHCGRAFADKGACNSHMRTHTRDQVYACTYCGQTFSQKPKLKYHIRKHTGENLETCPICSKLFTSLCTLREHMHIHNDNEKTPCSECGKVFTSERYMIRHLRSAHSDEGDSHECPLCDKTFSTIIKLRSHVLTHCALKTLECIFCRKKYSSRKSMMKHLKIRHQMIGAGDILKTSYRRLDPRDCDLNLDDRTINKIFGTSRRSRVPVESKDYVLYPKSLPSLVAERINKIDESGVEVSRIQLMDRKSDDGEDIRANLLKDTLGVVEDKEMLKIHIKLGRIKSRNEQNVYKNNKRVRKVKKRKKKKKDKSDDSNETLDPSGDQSAYNEVPLFPFISIKSEPDD